MTTNGGALSADSHVNVPIDDWARYLPETYRGRAPILDEAEDADYMIFEGRRSPIQGLAAMAGRKPEEYSERMKNTDARPGGWDPAERLKDQDIDGVIAEVLYGGGPPGQPDDIPFRFALYRAYNDWLADFCAQAPGRLFGIGFLPIFEIEGAVAELERIKEIGLVGAVLPTTQNIHPYGEPYWDPIWEAAQEMNIPLHFHAREGITVGGAKLPYEGRKKTAAWLTVGALTQFELAAELLFSGVYERVPRVRVGHVEGNVGWVPYMLERADQVYAQHRFWTRPPITMTPSELWRRNCFGTFIQDRVGVELRRAIGVENAMWSSDYPHSDTLWPGSQEAIGRMFHDVPEADKHALLKGNAIREYGLPL